VEPNDAEALKTILVVDDDPEIREVVFQFLKPHYIVLVAESGSEALQVSRQFKGEIQVLLSDFQMAGMSGIDLAMAITVDRPKLKVLLMSGFSKGLLVLNEGWHFLSKPFMGSQLRSLVETLANPDKISRFTDLERAELGDVKPPRLSPEVSRYKTSLEK
jgi:two-component system cell cycle sensor histidine kinase/response regulator CckA